MLLRRFRRRKAVSDPVTVVSRFVDAANRHDADAIAKCLHPDFESIQPIYPSRNFRGSMQVKRNWQAIFESEPGFRLSLVRSASHENTVWVELHGAGRDVEVAGVFIMGVEDELVRWARVYSAVVEQPPPKMATHEPEPAVAADEAATIHEEAEAIRRLIHAGRPAEGAAVASAEDAVTTEDEAFAPPADDAAFAAVLDDAPAAGDGSPAVVAADDDDEDEDDDEDDDDDSEYDDEDEYDDDDEDEDDDDADAAADELDQSDDGSGDDDPEADDEQADDDVAEAPPVEAVVAEADLPKPYADPDSFWQEGEVHDLVGRSKRRRRSGREATATATAGNDEDALVVDLNGRRSEAGDDPEGDDQSHRSGRRRGGRRRR
ncbi:MAG: hypothetical protein QOG43_1818 [Actinomycetota bacterium]|nr:hypothetical protein [Actinomycetota bacterium]